MLRPGNPIAYFVFALAVDNYHMIRENKNVK